MNNMDSTQNFVHGWTQIRVLGEGTYGEVRLLESEKGEYLAMKVIDMEQARERNDTSSIAKEVLAFAWLIF